MFSLLFDSRYFFFLFSLFFLKLYLIFLYNIVQVRHPVWGFGEVMTWVWEPVPANPLASVQGGCGHDMRREAAMAGLPLTHYSAMVLWLSGGLSFLNEHSLFWSSSFSSSQSVSSQAMSLPFLGLLSNPVFQHLVPVCTSLTKRKHGVSQIHSYFNKTEFLCGHWGLSILSNEVNSTLNSLLWATIFLRSYYFWQQKKLAIFTVFQAGQVGE